MSNSDFGEKPMTLRANAAGSDMLLAIWREFESGKLAHAYLFTGEKGVGKKTFSNVLAKAILCQAEGDKPCGNCRSCKRFESKTHGNVYYPVPQAKKTTIGVEDLRNILDELSRASLDGGRRVIVIHNAEKMTPASQNCLLKTLEEAPEGVFFLLVTDMERAILPTIRSRCRVVRISPWHPDRILRTLTEKGVPQSRARELTDLCEGSIGKALQMLDDEGYWTDRELVRKTFLNVKRVADVPAASQLLKDKKDDADRLLQILEQELRLFISQIAQNSRDEHGFFPEQWKAADVQSLCRIQDAVLKCKQYRLSNVGWAANAENLMMKIAEEARKWQQ